MTKPESARIFGYIVCLGALLFMMLGTYFSLGDSATSLGLSNAGTDYVTGLVWAFAILVSIAVWPVQARHKAILAILWLARIGYTLGLMLFYEGYYGLDAGYYFAEGIATFNPPELFAFGEGSDNMIALVAMHNMVLPVSYHATKVTCSLLGLIAVYLIYRAASLYRGEDDLRILYVLGLFPSITFWSSILGKDPITLLGVAVFVYAVVRFTLEGGARFIVVGALGLCLAAFIRVWLATLFTLPLCVLAFSSRQGLVGKVLALAIAVSSITLGILQFGERFDIESRADLVSATDSITQSFGEGGGSSQEIRGGISSIGEMLAFAPVGGVTALFRPLPGEVLNVFGSFAGLENALLLWLLMRALMAGNLLRLKEPLVVWVALTIVVWAVGYGFVSYQNLGTAFRYKVQVMPLLLMLLLYLGSRSGAHAGQAAWIRSA